MSNANLDDLTEIVNYDDKNAEGDNNYPSKSILNEKQFHKTSSVSETFLSLANNLTSFSSVSQIVISVCSICFKRYNSEGELYSHLIEQHGGRLKCRNKINLLQLQNCNNKLLETGVSQIAEETAPVIVTTGSADLSLTTSYSNTKANIAIISKKHHGDADDGNSKTITKPKAVQTEVPPLPLKYLKLFLRSQKKIHCKISSTCPYKFENKDKLKQHEQCHNCSILEQTKNYERFQCFECSMLHKTWRQCSNHLWKEHKIDVDLVHCPVCSYRASTIGN